MGHEGAARNSVQLGFNLEMMDHSPVMGGERVDPEIARARIKGRIKDLFTHGGAINQHGEFYADTFSDLNARYMGPWVKILLDKHHLFTDKLDHYRNIVSDFTNKPSLTIHIVAEGAIDYLNYSPGKGDSIFPYLKGENIFTGNDQIGIYENVELEGALLAYAKRERKVPPHADQRRYLGRILKELITEQEELRKTIPVVDETSTPDTSPENSEDNKEKILLIF